MKNGEFQKSVIAYLMLVDSNFNYIKANGNSDMNVTINVNLQPGTYYLITDINFRYVQSTHHGYNLTAYASNPVGIYGENTKNIEAAFKIGLYTYAKKELTSQSHAGGSLYQSKKSESEFPFNFLVFDNTGDKDVTLTDTLQCKSSKCVDFYFEGSNNKSSSIKKQICTGQWEVFAHMPYSYSSLYSYQLSSSSKNHSGAAAPKGCPSLENK